MWQSPDVQFLNTKNNLDQPCSWGKTCCSSQITCADLKLDVNSLVGKMALNPESSETPALTSLGLLHTNLVVTFFGRDPNEPVTLMVGRVSCSTIPSFANYCRRACNPDGEQGIWFRHHRCLAEWSWGRLFWIIRRVECKKLIGIISPQGGHVRGSNNWHAQTFYDDLPAFLQKYCNTGKVMFCCSSSAGRGPRCARWYNSLALIWLHSYLMWNFRFVKLGIKIFLIKME